jgi:O-antigen/teichoic acid export membrane protein
MNPLKKLAGETALYGISSILGRAVNFLLVPFYTGIFPSSEYGVVTKLYAYAAFFNIIYTYGMETGFFRFASKGDRQITYNNVFTLILGSSTFFTLVIILLSGSIASGLGYPGQDHLITWLALTLAIDAVVSIPFALLRLEKKAAKFAAIRLSNVFINVGLNIFFLLLAPAIVAGEYGGVLARIVEPIYNPNLGIGYIFLSNLIANALYLLMLYKEIISAKLKFQWERIKPMLVYAYPLLFMGLAGMINEMLDRVIMEEILPDDFYADFTSLEALGIYGACYKLSLFITLAVQAFKYAAEPFFFTSAADKNSPALFARIMHWFIIFCTLAFIVISINLDILGQLLLRRPEYRTGLDVVPLLLLANIFLGIYYNLSIWFKLSDQTGYGTKISFIGAGITVVFNFLLIPILGYMGAALTTLICYAYMATACYLLGAKHYPIPYNVKAALLYMLLGCVLVAMAYYLNPQDFLMKYSLRIILVGIFVLAVVWAEKIKLTALTRK